MPYTIAFLIYSIILSSITFALLKWGNFKVIKTIKHIKQQEKLILEELKETYLWN